MAKKLIELVDEDSGRRSYSPLQYNENSEVKRFQKDGGDLDRLIYETGTRIIFDSITDISKIDFYTLSQEEKNKLWSGIASRMRACNSPFLYSKQSDGMVRHFMQGLGGFNPYQCIAKTTNGGEEIFNRVIIDCYARAKDIKGLKDFGKELQERGFVKQAKEIYETIQKFKSQLPQPPINFDEL
ncbi:MAG: hypothetical protein PHH54_00060 [Candidatus Nanoarchaeia archaeon]|nr:hypothetical protein [Candidatus Nanoarchaeia archaeon]MDD5740356.1 hypothetical protein [Candidatus Nanoarchaeia archaeon]